MRLPIFLTLLLAALIASTMSSGAAEETKANTNGIATAADGKFTEVKKIIYRLRAKQKAGGEERIVPVGAIWLAATGGHTSSTESVMHAVEYDEPLPKWAKAIVAIIGIGLAAGTIYGGIKLSQTLNSDLNNTST
ncbi:unnamed protein product [Phytophthora fragariaefolia]|uniref:Unnamed protein product n=1 Tax=Phytophthora fragariaefolia TaxID=1490495 RepID=A0A9W6TNS6_9STRA|nr:unnamed protein product [Phytophthora fragariaefolia]